MCKLKIIFGFVLKKIIFATQRDKMFILLAVTCARWFYVRWKYILIFFFKPFHPHREERGAQVYQEDGHSGGCRERLGVFHCGGQRQTETSHHLVGLTDTEQGQAK